MKRSIFVILLVCGMAHGLFAQLGPNSTFNALNQFLDTDFFSEFQEMKNRAENSVKDFKARYEHRYSPEEIAQLKDYYNMSADRFNQVLYNLKDDLMRKQVRNYLISYPDKYSKEIETDLRRAQEFYASTYQQELQSKTDGELTGIDLITLVPEVIKYGKLAIAVIQRIQTEVKKFNDNILTQHLVEKYRFRTWDEL